MIRIGTNRCGYTGYTCRGIPQLHGSHETVVEGTTITVQHMFNEANELVSAMRQEFDKLPLRIKGMVFAADTINMGWPEGGPHPEVPEISCRYDTDPFSISKKVAEQSSQIAVAISGQTYQYPVFGSTNGWVDLFNACDVTGGTDGYCYRRDVFLEKTLDTEEGGITVKGHTLALVDNIPTFVSGNTEYIMGPGLLEPMLDTDFDPIDIDTIPAWEAGDDSFIFTTTVLGAWKAVVDDRFRNVYARLNNIPTAATDYNLRDLKREEYENTDCQNFRINLSSGDSLQTRGNQVANLYTVTDGQVAVDDYSVYVSGDIFTVEPAVEYPIYVWVRVYETDGTGETTTAEIILLDDSYDIGDELSGGEVIAKEQISVPGSAYRYKYTVQFDDGRKYTGLLFFGFPLPDADDHVVVVGGVRKVFGGTDDDSFVLFKIFQTECSPVMNFASDAETGLHGVIDFDIDGNEIITPLPGSTITPAPGIVQPAVNIALVVNGSTETNTQSTTDVPTVEAVYNFIHGITAYNGPVADAKATEVELSGISGSTVFGEPVDYVIPINKDRWAQNTEDEISGYTAAASMYEAAKAAWELAGEPTEGEIYEAYIEASTVYSDAYYTVYGDVSDGEPGTTYVINNIVLMNGDMMGVAATTAPSVRAVYNFVHDIYALSKAGTILVNEQNVPYVKHGTPGTVFTIDSLDKARYEAEEYYQDEVPTVKAVMDYVKMEGATSSTVGIIGYTTNQPEVLWPIPGSTVDPDAGYVQNVRNIYVSGTHSVSGYAVPTVDAVYNFIHNIAVEGMTFSSALVTGGTLAEITATAEDVTTVTGYTATGEPGTCYMATAIPVGSTVSIGLDNCAPTVQAVIDYVGAMDVNAVAGTLINGSTTEEWAVGQSYTNPVRGTVEVSSQIVVGATPGLSLQTVPSVKSIYDFVHNGSTDDAYRALATGGTVSNAFGPTYMATKTPPNAPSYRKWNKNSTDQNIAGTAASVTGWTPGTINVIDTIVYVRANMFIIEGSGSITVPSVMAVYDFVHNAYALAEPGTVKVMSGTTTRYVAHGTPGTVYSVDTIDVDVYNAGAYNPGSAAGYNNNGSYWYEEVPTVRAVIQYVEGRACPSAVNGIISVNAGTESLASVQGTTAAAGIVQPVKNIDIGTQDPNAVSPTAVPTVQAVYDFIHGYTITDYKVADAKATADETIAVAGSTVQVKCGTSAVPGTFYVTNDMTNITDTVTTYVAPEAVPTAMSVVNYIRAYVAGHTATASRISVSDDSPYESLDAVHTTGTVDVSRCINLNLTINKRPESSRVVPTVEAVYNFVHDISDFYSGSSMSVQSSQATRGTITGTTTGTSPVITGATASGCTVGTYKVVSNIVGATNAQGGLFSVDDVVPTADAIVKYIKSLNLDPAGMAVSGNLNQYGDWVTASTVSAGIYYVATNVVAGTAGSMAYSSVPTVRAVNDFVAGYTASVGGFSVTVADKEDWETTGTPATQRKADPGIVGVVDTLVAATTVSNRSLSVKTVPTVAAVKDYVDTHVPDMAVSGDLNAAGDWVTASTVSAGIFYVATNVVGGTTGSMAYSSVPTVRAIYDFIHSTATDVSNRALATGGTMSLTADQTGIQVNGATNGTCRVVKNIITVPGSTQTLNAPVVPSAQAVVDYINTNVVQMTGATVGILTVTDTTEIIEDITGSTHAAGSVQTVANIWMSDQAAKRVKSRYAVPTVEAVIGYIRGTTSITGATTESSLADIAGSTITGTTALALVSTAKPGTVYVTNDFTLYGSTVTTYNDPQAVPTVKAVVDYVRLYGGSTDLAVVGSFTATTSAEAWVSGSTASAGIFKVVKDVKMATTDSDAARSISRTSVPTVEAVYLFVSGYTATVGSFTATSSAETWVSGSTATAGITKVVSNIAMASTDTAAARSISKTAVPTVEAVKKYVDDHVYTGPFAVEATGTGTNVKIKEGKAYFGTTVFTYAGIASTAMANSATLYAKCTKGSSTITIVTTDTTGSTVACFPIASKDANGNITQRQWGDINITGRWM